MKTFVKTSIILILTILVFAALDIFYFHSAMVNTIMIASIPDVELIGKFHEGTLTFADLWRPFGEHRLLGFRLLFILNGVLFNLNVFNSLYLVVATFVIFAIILYFSYKKSFGKTNGTIALQLSFVPIAVVVFSLTQLPGLLEGGMTTQFVISILLALVALLLLENLFNEFAYSKLAWLVLMIFVLTLLFGGGYSAGFYLSMFAVLILRSLMERRFSFQIILPVLISSFIAYYLYKQPAFSLSGNGNSIPAMIAVITRDPVVTIQYFIKLFAASLIGQSANGYGILKTLTPYYVIGTTLAVCYAYAVFTYFSTKMWKKTYMPVFLMVYALSIMVAVWLGRSHLPENALNPWYIPFTRLGSIAVLWIVYYQYGRNRRTSNMVIAGAVTIFIIGSQLFGYYAELKTSPHRKFFMSHPRDLALIAKENIVGFGSGEIKYTQFNSDINATMKALEVMEKYNLSFYRDVEKVEKIPYLNNVNLVDGWYEKQLRADGSSYRWIDKVATFIVNSGDIGTLSIEGYLPPFNDGAKLEISVNGEKLYREVHATGYVAITFDIPKNQQLTVEIRSNKVLSPKAAGIGIDPRQLSLVINGIVAQ